MNQKKSGTPPVPRILIILLVIIAFLSVLGLDYLNWSRGGNSVFFKSSSTPEEKIPAEENLGDILQRELEVQSISPVEVSQFWDSDDIQHLMVDLNQKDYERILQILESKLEEAGASITKKEEHRDEEKIYFLWQVKGRDKQRISILFSCRRLKESHEKIRPVSVGAHPIAIIVDDMGYSLKAINDVCRMRLPLTIAIIPYTPLARETAELAHQNNIEILLHLPMESLNNAEENTMAGLINSKMDRKQIVDILEKDLSQIPYIKGVNNHMGSRITRSPKFMRIILERLRLHSLFFIDSVTTADSVGMPTARSLHIPTARRDVFLDGVLNREYIRDRLAELYSRAGQKGSAVAICHPNPVTLQTLKEELPKMKDFGCRLVPVSEVVR